jgi:hypothetical protein
MATKLVRGGAGLILLATTFAVAQEDKGPPIGNLPATTVQLPTFGISIDAEGTLDAKTFREFDGRDESRQTR